MSELTFNMSELPSNMSELPSDISDSSDDEETIDELLETVFGGEDVRKKLNRVLLEKKIVLVNFNVSENGPCNYRDGTVLGDHTAAILPSSFKNATRVKISVHLNHEFEPSDATTVTAPTFVRKHLKASSQQMARKWPLEKNEIWLVPAELGASLKVDFKKRHWDLSRGFRKVCDNQWPKFVLLAEAYMADDSIIKVISDEFEVRSKEQSNKSRAARGLSTHFKRRRTPETEARAAKLQGQRADIIDKREHISNMLSRQSENETKFNFIEAILKTCSDPAAKALLHQCQQQTCKMSRWKHN